MKNYLYTGDTLDIVAPAGGVVSGNAYLIGTIIGVAVATAAVGATVAMRVEGVFTLPKLSTDVVTQGALLYWDNTNFRLTLTSAGNTLAGIAWAAAGNGPTTVQIKLKGR